MNDLNYYNMSTDSWKGTRLVFICNDSAFIRLYGKIVNLIENDSDDYIRKYSFTKRAKPIIGKTDTIFLVDSELSDDDLNLCNINKIKIITMDYESATGYTNEQQMLAVTDWRLLKMIEKYIPVPMVDEEGQALLALRKSLRARINQNA